MGPGREQADRHSPPPSFSSGRTGGRFAPPDIDGCLLHVAHQVGVQRLAAGADLFSRAEQVLAADLQPVDAQPAGHLVQLRLPDPLQVGGAEGAVGAGRSCVGVDAVSLHRHRPPAVRAGGGVAGRGGDPGSVVRVRAGVQPGLALPAEQGPVGRGRGTHPGGHAVPPGGDHRLVHRVEDPHRAAGLAGDGRGQRLHLGVGLAAEAAAEERHDDPHLVERQPEQHGDLLADQERVLAGGPQGQLAAVPVRDRGVGLHRVLVDGREGVLPLDDHGGVREGAAGIAAPERVAVAGVAIGVGQVTKTVRAARPGPVLVDQRGVRGERRFERGRDREFVVGHVDERDRGVGRGLGLGRDHGDRLAQEPDLAQGHDRPVAQRVAVVGIDVGQVRGGEHGHYAGGGLRGLGADRGDPGVGHLAVQDRAVEHAGQPEVAGVFGLAGELEPAVGAFHALPYGGSCGRHPWPPRSSVSESRIET